jgi:indoleamine 2,3-dioxygenase
MPHVHVMMTHLWAIRNDVCVCMQAYMWGGGPDVPTTLPAVLARPWATVAAALHMPPVLVYATYNLMNWRRLDTTCPVELGNIAVQHVGAVCE